MQLRRVILFIAVSISALTAGAFTISGTVLDDQGAPLPFAIVSLDSTLGNPSDMDGHFLLKNVSAGTHELHIHFMGYEETYVPLTVSKDTSLTISMKATQLSLPTTVLSISRSPSSIEDAPVPITVITKEQIERTASIRLQDVLIQQAGLSITNDHGQGIQIQGLEADYVLILMDGEPMVGRSAGTLDLSRIPLGNVERIEILKGPASSIYGSEAMAGVINIITKKGSKKPITLSGDLKYATNNTWNMNVGSGFSKGKLSGRVDLNRYSTDGFDLTPNTISQSTPAHSSYTVAPSLNYRISDKLSFGVQGRYFTEDQENLVTFSFDEGDEVMNETANQTDWSVSLILRWKISKALRSNTRVHYTGYKTFTDYAHLDDGSLYDSSDFQQHYARVEQQFVAFLKDNHKIVTGIGVAQESVDASRYRTEHTFQSAYAYGQYELKYKGFVFLPGARFDAHSEYTNGQLSPKLAISKGLGKKWKVKGSVGTGFKTPDFRQLYLSFTNPTVGYSVFGSMVLDEELERLEEQGQIQSMLVDPSEMEAIRAESSLSGQFGLSYKPSSKLSLSFGAFHNDVKDMIETLPILTKTNGQQAFSYVNLNKVFTQGLDAEIDWRPTTRWALSLGYQFLNTGDKQVIEDIKAGTIYTRDHETLISTKVKLENYGGLFNRSKHMATMRLFYTHPKGGWSGSLVGIYRSRYGYQDINGNAILDDESEYAEGFMLWNLAISKKLNQNVGLQAGIENLFGYTAPQYQPGLSGRIFFATVRLGLGN